MSRAADLVRLPDLESDNALPRWLADEAGYEVTELPDRARLALDLDTPLDLAIVARAPGAPAALRQVASAARLAVPRLDEVREVVSDPAAELLVAGRLGSATLRWLERRTDCRVRALVEERGLRSGATLAAVDRATAGRGTGGTAPGRARRRPRSVLGRLLSGSGPGSLGRVVAELADAAVIDTRVLLADRLGPDESAWPSFDDRAASDLLTADDVVDPWLRALTAAAAGSPIPILLGSHTLVGPGLPVLLRHRPPAAPRSVGGTLGWGKLRRRPAPTRGPVRGAPPTHDPLEEPD